MSFKPTLESLALHANESACNKHGLAPDCRLYAQDIVDRASNSEFLAIISDALDELLSFPKPAFSE